MKINVSASISGQTLDKFCETLAHRMEYLHETARDSIAAIAVDTLRSIRTQTKVAKVAKPKVNISRESSLKPSFYTIGGKKKLCVRINGVNRVNLPTCSTEPGPIKGKQVFRFDRHDEKGVNPLYIIANSMTDARKKAQYLKSLKIRRYAGLARKAITTLMAKTSTINLSDPTSAAVALKASSLTRKSETINRNTEGGTYTLKLSDDLRYALLALKGGPTAVDLAMRKAMNKTISVINHKTKATDFFGNAKKLPTPFPEIRGKRAA